MKQILDWMREQITKLKDEAVSEQRISYANNEVENYHYAMGKGWTYYNVLKIIDEAEEKYLENYFKAKGAVMKEIFDWLREQMHDRIKWFQTMDTTDVACDVAIKETERFIEYINEAEAKWEADCCEWKLSRATLQRYSDCVWTTSCNNGKEIEFHTPHYVVRKYNFCPYCGKPIKIVEV